MGALYDENRTARSADDMLAGIASRQHGVFTRKQAEACGFGDGAIRWRLRTGRWERVHSSVYRLAGVPATWRQRAFAACAFFGPGAAVSHHAALVLHRLRRPQRIQITIPRHRHRSGAGSIEIHSATHAIPPSDRTAIDAIPVTRPARTLLDLAASDRTAAVEAALDEAVRRRLVSLPFLERWLDDPRREPHRGRATLLRLVEERATVGVTDSPLEGRLLRLIRDDGLPIPMLQYVVTDGDRFAGRVDFAYPERRVAIEADGFRFHDVRDRFDAERARGNALEALGWRVLRVTSRHLDDDPESVVVWIRGALDVAHAEPAPACR